MSDINIIIESLFRARGLAQKLRPAVLAYKLVYNKLPLRNIVSNGTKENKLYNGKLHDKIIPNEFIQRLYNSKVVPNDFEISSGYDENNLAFISFKAKLTSQLEEILNKIKTFNNTYVEVNHATFSTPLIIITTKNWSDGNTLPQTLENWFDSITSALEDKPFYDDDYN